MVEGGTELVQLLLSDSLAVPGEDLVLHLVDCPETQTASGLRIVRPGWAGGRRGGESGSEPRERSCWSGLVIYIVQLGWAQRGSDCDTLLHLISLVAPQGGAG